MKKIIVGYDGTGTADEALAAAIDQATAFGGKIFVVFSQVGKTSESQKEIEDAESALKWAEAKIRKKGIDVEIHHMVRGLSAGEDLVTFGNEIGADLIVIGIEKRSKVSKLMFGSTAQFTILEANCPVLTVK